LNVIRIHKTMISLFFFLPRVWNLVSLWVKNIMWEYSRTGCWGEYLEKVTGSWRKIHTV
jgi:hypothetical protein